MVLIPDGNYSWATYEMKYVVNLNSLEIILFYFSVKNYPYK